VFHLVAASAHGESGPTRRGRASTPSARAGRRRRPPLSSLIVGAILVLLFVFPAPSFAGCDAESISFLDDEAGPGSSFPQLDGVAASGLGLILPPPEGGEYAARPAFEDRGPRHDPPPAPLLRAPPRH